MNLGIQDKSTSFATGKEIGFILALLIFLSILFTMLSLLGKLPIWLKYLHVIFLALLVYCVRSLAKRAFK